MFNPGNNVPDALNFGPADVSVASITSKYFPASRIETYFRCRQRSPSGVKAMGDDYQATTGLVERCRVAGGNLTPRLPRNRA